MAESALITALKGKGKQLNLNSRKLSSLSRAIGKLNYLESLSLQKNHLSNLPKELSLLTELRNLNLGNNEYDILPNVLQYLSALEKLYLFSNKLNTLNGYVIGSLVNLTHLNLNNNSLGSLCPEIGRLSFLEVLSAEHNCLSQLPFEICALSRLKELWLGWNRLTLLPAEISYLYSLIRLSVPRNSLKDIPESISKMHNLRSLDIAGNEIRIFPTEIASLSLRELYAEENPLLHESPVHSIQEEEILQLKEITVRFILSEIRCKISIVRKNLPHYPEIRDMIATSSKCYACGGGFLNTWLECVRFASVDEMVNGISKKTSKTIPIRATLCSYKCFNTPNHGLYGVAFL